MHWKEILTTEELEHHLRPRGGGPYKPISDCTLRDLEYWFQENVEGTRTKCGTCVSIKTKLAL